MGFTETLLLILFVLKLFSLITISWWYIVTPAILVLVIHLIDFFLRLNKVSKT